MITREQIVKFAPGAKADLVNAILRNWEDAEKAGITKNVKRLQRFMASIGVETGGLKSVSESLTYTSAQRIYDIFKGPAKNRRFANVKACEPYVRQPEKLAIKVYGGRLGNKAAPSRDGWLYRGAGMMQTTGRDNFRALGFEDNPDALRDPEVAFTTAVKEWVSRKCNALADREDDQAVRKAINGGLNGYDEFLAYIAKARRVWPNLTSAEDDEPRGVYAPPVDVVEEDEPPVPRPREERPIATITDRATVTSVQSLLRDLGYTEVGEPDGRMGKMTRTAILAFRNENDLPVNDTIDNEFIEAIAAAKPRELAQARVDATPKEVREAVPEVKASFFSRAWAWFLGGGALSIGAVTGAGDVDPDQRGFFKTVLGYVTDVPGWVWCAMIAVVALAIVYNNHRAVKMGEEAFKAGARR